MVDLGDRFFPLYIKCEKLQQSMNQSYRSIKTGEMNPGSRAGGLEFSFLAPNRLREPPYRVGDFKEASDEPHFQISEFQ